MVWTCETSDRRCWLDKDGIHRRNVSDQFVLVLNEDEQVRNTQSRKPRSNRLTQIHLQKTVTKLPCTCVLLLILLVHTCKAQHYHRDTNQPVHLQIFKTNLINKHLLTALPTAKLSVLKRSWMPHVQNQKASLLRRHKNKRNVYTASYVSTTTVIVYITAAPTTVAITCGTLTLRSSVLVPGMFRNLHNNNNQHFTATIVQTSSTTVRQTVYCRQYCKDCRSVNISKLRRQVDIFTRARTFNCNVRWNATLI